MNRKQEFNSSNFCSFLVFTRSGLKSITVLFPLLGITWIFGVMALGSQTIVFQYLFALCNSLQGLFIFIFHCLCNSEVRRVKKEINDNKLQNENSSLRLPSVRCDVSKSRPATQAGQRHKWRAESPSLFNIEGSWYRHPALRQ